MMVLPDEKQDCRCHEKSNNTGGEEEEEKKEPWSSIVDTDHGNLTFQSYWGDSNKVVFYLLLGIKTGNINTKFLFCVVL